MKRYLLSVFLLLGFVAISLPHLSYAQSATGTQMLTGWAWSSNIGWVSFNCEQATTNSCITTKYKVEIMPNGSVSGDAWSSNIGWIHFGGLSGFPSGSGTASSNASFNGSSLSGWAEALANGGGWDGWLSLKGNTTTSVNADNAPLPTGSTTPAAGTQGSYGVTASGNNLTGYAWGSDVIGWLSFSGPGYGVSIVPNDPSTDLTAANPDDCYGPDGYLIHDGTSRLYYKDSNVPSGQVCDSTDNSELRLCTAGVLGGTYTNPSCTVGATTTPGAFQTGLAPALSLAIVSNNGGAYSHSPLVVTAGTPVDVKWKLDPSGGVPDVCTGAGALASQDLSSLLGGSTGTFGPFTVNASQTYTVTCSNAYGTSTDSVRAVIFSVNEF